MKPFKLPHPASTAYRAAAHLHKTGPLSRADLFAQVHFGNKRSNREQMLGSAVANGWIDEVPSGLDISKPVRNHFDALEVEPVKFVGQIAGPRIHDSAYDRPPHKGITNSRGDHARAIDERFQRGPEHHFFSVPTGGAA
jgi:hypothetical protein